jgi:charged multivesicular body protein 5
MKRVFGKKKTDLPAPSLDAAASGIATRVTGMDQKIAALDLELRGYKDKLKSTKSPAAKQMLQKRAMEVLKRKRMYETQRDNAAGQQFNIDQTAFNLESAQATVTTVAAMKAAHGQLKQTLKKDLNIDHVDELADDMAELMYDMNEINEALGQNFATPDNLDEADLDAELEMLGGELEDELYEETAAADSTPSYMLPAQPNTTPGSQVPIQSSAFPSAPIRN